MIRNCKLIYNKFKNLSEVVLIEVRINKEVRDCQECCYHCGLLTDISDRREIFSKSRKPWAARSRCTIWPMSINIASYDF